MSVDDPLPDVEGLAEGKVGDDPLGELPEPPAAPLGLLLSELPDVPAAWAAARPGTRPMTTTSSMNSNFFIARLR
jgi:hypothetical protein